MSRLELETRARVCEARNFYNTMGTHYYFIWEQTRIVCGQHQSSASGLCTLKGHGHDVSAYLRESVHSVGVVKCTCTLYTAQLEYQTVAFKIDYTYTEKYPDPNVVTMAL